MGHGTSLNPNFPCSNHRRRRFGHDGAGHLGVGRTSYEAGRILFRRKYRKNEPALREEWAKSVTNFIYNRAAADPECCSEVLQLCSDAVIGWLDAPSGLFGLWSIQMASI
jgi:hypothetical protein